MGYFVRGYFVLDPCFRPFATLRSQHLHIMGLLYYFALKIFVYRIITCNKKHFNLVIYTSFKNYGKLNYNVNGI